MFADVRVRVKPRWVAPELMGNGELSKALVVLHFDSLRENPECAMLALRAWALRRFQRGDFHLQKSCRQHWLERERAALRADIAALARANGLTGSVRADDLIRVWAPEVLPS